MVLPQADIEKRKELALSRCDEQIRWYEKNKTRSRQVYQVLQGSIILLTGLTPILILWSDLPKVVQALPAALAGILAGFSHLSPLKENYIHFAYAVEKLKSEKVKYLTRTTREYRSELGDEEALNNFVMNVETLGMTEVSDWQRMQELELTKEKGSFSETALRTSAK